MIWFAIAVGGFAVWLAVVVFFVALCSAASRADRRANAPRIAVKPNVIDFSTVREFHGRRGAVAARRASALG